MKAHEVNFDGLVGPTHNYAGLAYGNMASDRSRARPSSPRQAALQGLAKMQTLHRLGLMQGLFPPQHRPHLACLRQLGFTGSPARMLARAARQAPEILAACSSASAMWVANAATVSPGQDTADGRVHFTPANLSGSLHRALETPFTARMLKKIFPAPEHFHHHAPLPAVPQFADEGAANHSRFCAHYSDPGVALFVYGMDSGRRARPRRFPARQSLAASKAIARQHQLTEKRCLFVQQNPQVIDQGVFHNDVIALANRHTLFCHERAFVDPQAIYRQLREACQSRDFTLIEVPDKRITVPQAVASYLFNSQLVSSPSGQEILVAPAECREDAAVYSFLEELVAGDAPVSAVEFLDLRQSMNNGGGPACLRLRVVLSEAQLKATHQPCLLDDSLFLTLEQWINRHYRDRLIPADLADPLLLDESCTALDELTRILDLGSLYDFQT